MSNSSGSKDDSALELEPEDMEQTLLNISECFVYRIPPLKNESGHRANDWDVNKWIWSGRLRVQSKGPKLIIILEDVKTGELFATCPVSEDGPKAVEPVVDSSRYFVLRIDDGQGHHAFIGMGFRDRNESYDFNAAMQDHWRGVKRQREAEVVRSQLEERLASQPPMDLSLKEGEKLKINLNMGGTTKVKKERPKGTGFLAPPPGGGLLAPPPATAVPPPPTARANASTNPATTPAAPSPPAAASQTSEEDDWGDFEDGAGGSDEFGDFK